MKLIISAGSSTVDVWGISGSPVAEGNPPLPGGPQGFHSGIERDERLPKITGIGGDAMLAGAENGVFAVDAFKRPAARTGPALVARPRDLAEVFAARPLPDVAAKASHVADLLAGGELKAFRNETG
jgi:hypothetical protein